MKDLKKFLIKAKKNTYALSGETGEKNLVDGAKELTGLHPIIWATAKEIKWLVKECLVC